MTSPYSAHLSPPAESRKCRNGAAASIAARDARIQGCAGVSDHGSVFPRAAFFGAMPANAARRRWGARMLPGHDDTAAEMRGATSGTTTLDQGMQHVKTM